MSAFELLRALPVPSRQRFLAHQSPAAARICFLKAEHFAQWVDARIMSVGESDITLTFQVSTWGAIPVGLVFLSMLPLYAGRIRRVRDVVGTDGVRKKVIDDVTQQNWLACEYQLDIGRQGRARPGEG